VIAATDDDLDRFETLRRRALLGWATFVGRRG
jgi:hypothetical protein